MEWGILWSPARAGTGRYPSLAWAQSTLSHLRKFGGRTAVHMCGASVRELLAGGPGPERDLVNACDRVQLNFTASSDISLSSLNAFLRESPVPVITQYNAANAQLCRSMATKNHHVLFDESGGRGIPAPSLIAPTQAGIGSKFFGYAGGLGPEGLDDQANLMDLASEGRDFYCDMEGRIRTDGDRFDLAAAARVIEIYRGLLSRGPAAVCR